MAEAEAKEEEAEAEAEAEYKYEFMEIIRQLQKTREDMVNAREDSQHLQEQFREQQALQATELSEIKVMMSTFLHEWRVKNDFHWMPRVNNGPHSIMPPPEGYKKNVPLPR